MSIVDAESRVTVSADQHYDVIVLGGGPAGASTAAIAARNGRKVMLIERSKEPRFKIGESLMPQTYSTFEKMGVLDALRESDFPEKHSVQFFTKDGKASSPFYFDSVDPSPSAQTWQVLRANFDAMLIDAARDAGADCRLGWRARQVVTEGDAVVGVRANDENGEQREYACSVLVDATGQGSLVAKELDLRRVDYGLDHAAFFSHFKGAIRDQGRDEGATLILHTNDGRSWFWYIPLPNDIVSVGVVGSVNDLVRYREGKPHEVFYEEVERCSEIKRRLEPAYQCRPIQAMKDFSYRWDRIAGNGWVLAGDAYSFIDPVYSSGVFLALKSGEMIAENIEDAYEFGDFSGKVLGSHQRRYAAGMEAIYQLVLSFYSPNFSLGAFLKGRPYFQRCVTRILTGDVFDSYFGDLIWAMEQDREEKDTMPLSRSEIERMKDERSITIA